MSNVLSTYLDPTSFPLPSGTVVTWNGTTFIALSPSLDFDNLVISAGVPAWVTLSGSPTPVGTVSSAGVSAFASKADHVHATPLLGSLSDVSVVGAITGDVLVYDQGTSTWVNDPTPVTSGIPGFTATQGLGYVSLSPDSPNMTLVLGGVQSIIQSIQSQIPDSTAAGGDVRGDNAVDWQLVRTLATQVASGLESVISGGSSNRASGSGSSVGGGQGNTASGSRASVAGGQANTASGTFNATVGGGSGNTVSGSWATVGGGSGNTASINSHVTIKGGSSNTASGSVSSVAGGQGNTASGGTSSVAGGQGNIASSIQNTVGGGQGNSATSSYSTVSGGLGASAYLYGMFSHASGQFSAQGDAQFSRVIVRVTGTSSARVLTLNGSTSASSTNRIDIPANTAYQFRIGVIARPTSSTTAGSTWWDFRGMIKRDGSNNTTLVGAVSTLTGTMPGTPTYTVTVTADNTNNALQISGTGTARFVATVELTKVSY